MRTFRAICLFLIAGSASLSAATFVVPPDRDLIRRADAVVVGRASASHAQLTPAGTIETVTEITVEEVVKGAFLSEAAEIHEPGGSLDGIATWIPGVPRFEAGERVLLFLTRTPQRTWTVTDIALGKFSIAMDDHGRELALRAEGDINGWNPDGSAHHEPRRLAAPFMRFLHVEAAGGTAAVDYVVPEEPPRLRPAANSSKPPKLVRGPLSFSASSYTGDLQNCPGPSCGNGYGARWNAFPVTLYTEPGTVTVAALASSAAIAAWANNSGSSIGYVYGGTDPCSPSCHAAGFTATDSYNTILWERDLSIYGIPPFVCSPGGGVGTLGIGGVTSTVATHTGPNGETFLTNVEADVEMNLGVLLCFPLPPFASDDLTTAVAHELGHTLGLRHADETRAGDPTVPCATDPSLDCAGANDAIMKVVIPLGISGVLQPWDQRAAAAVYPPASPPPAAPTGVAATATTNNNIRVTWNVVSGLTYNVVRRGAGGATTTFSNVTSPYDNTVTAGTAFLYSVTATNSSGTSAESTKDLATAILFTDTPICVDAGTPVGCSAATRIRAVHVGELTTAINAVCALAGTAAIPGSAPGVNAPIGATYFTNMRAALDAARRQLSLTTITYTDPVLYGVGNPQGQPPTRVRKAHIDDLRTGVQ